MIALLPVWAEGFLWTFLWLVGITLSVAAVAGLILWSISYELPACDYDDEDYRGG